MKGTDKSATIHRDTRRNKLENKALLFITAAVDFDAHPQARQREFVTVISLGCITFLFAKHVSQDYNGSSRMMVNLIPLAVHVLLVRDIYVKWENRYGLCLLRYYFVLVMLQLMMRLC